MRDFGISKDPEFLEAIRQLNELNENGEMMTVAEAEIETLMMSLEKADLSFQTMTQVRDKIFAAYQEMMSIEV